jgi:hypothetical protein
MKKSSPPKTMKDIGIEDQPLGILFEEIRKLVQAARKTAVTAINSLQVLTGFEIGRMIVEHEQQGAQRAEYGKKILKELSVRLTEEFGQGFSRSNLEYMRKFYLAYRERLPKKSQMPSGKLHDAPKSQIPSGKSTRQGELPFRLSCLESNIERQLGWMP